MLAAKACLPFPASLASRQGVREGGAPAPLLAEGEDVSVYMCDRGRVLRMPLSVCKTGCVQEGAPGEREAGKPLTKDNSGLALGLSFP